MKCLKMFTFWFFFLYFYCKFLHLGIFHNCWSTVTYLYITKTMHKCLYFLIALTQMLYFCAPCVGRAEYLKLSWYFHAILIDGQTDNKVFRFFLLRYEALIITLHIIDILVSPITVFIKFCIHINHFFTVKLKIYDVN